LKLYILKTNLYTLQFHCNHCSEILTSWQRATGTTPVERGGYGG